MKPYQQVPIQECGEALVPIPAAQFARVDPHPYLKLNAPYQGKSPFYLREGVLTRLVQAQERLQQLQPNWRIQVFDAYRPIAVQAFMVDYSLRELAQAKGLNPQALTDEQRQILMDHVSTFWAMPSANPATPPPHSTGGAIDVTLVDGTGRAIAMGSEIDEMSPRSFPNYFETAVDPLEQEYHQRRQWLNQCMAEAGFMRHPNEWWHFSYGDQMWAWLMNQRHPDRPYVAQYGSI